MLLVDAVAGVDQLYAKASGLAGAAVTRPLARLEFVHAAAALFIGGTIYCAIYCRVAFYPMHEGDMPLWLSAWWAATALLPWFVAFEAMKRIVPTLHDRRFAFGACAIIAALTATATISLHRLANIEIMGMSPHHWPSLIANQLQPTVLFILLVCLWAYNRGRAGSPAEVLVEAGEELPPIDTIQWIRAAGNYVEVKCGERLIMRRMTMRRAEQATPSADFVRIHRSVIVRRQLIEGFDRSRRSSVVLTTGEALPVGDSYRRSVERIVPSSPDLSLQHIHL